MNFKTQLPIPEPALSWFLQACKNTRVELVYGKHSKIRHGYFQPISKSRNAVSGKIHLYAQSNSFRLLFTAIHELAHAIVWLDFDRVSSAHGSEWKIVFTELLLFANQYDFFPDDLQKVIEQHTLQTVFACSGTDIELELAFRKYDKFQKLSLLDIPIGMEFQLEGRQFIKLRKLTKRFECKELQTNRLYRINALAEIQLIH